MIVTIWHNGTGRDMDIRAGAQHVELLDRALRLHRLRSSFMNLRSYGLFSEGGEEITGRLVEPAALTLRRKIIRLLHRCDNVRAKEEAMDTSKVTRVEVIDHSLRGQASLGRATERGSCIQWLGVSAELSLQDEGRTLKIFLSDSETSAYDVRMAIQRGPARALQRAEDLPQAAGLMSEDVPNQARS